MKFIPIEHNAASSNLAFQKKTKKAKKRKMLDKKGK